MVCSQDPLYFPLPVLENQFTSNELDEICSFFQPPGNAADGDPLFSNPDLEQLMEEKKRKRKISNRESARRCRLRKKRYMADLTAQANQLKAQNREYNNRLTLVLNQLHAVNTHNQLLRSESLLLIQRYADLNRVLKSMPYSQSQDYKNNMFMNNLNSERFVDGDGVLFS